MKKSLRLRSLLLLFISLLCFGCSTPKHQERLPATTGHELNIHYLTVNYGEKVLQVRVGVQNPDGDIKGDILYVHGFADRLDNHGPLFEAWNRVGFRVIGFDLPSHGENSGSADNLNDFDFKALADLIAKVEQDTKPSETRPLILSGWSTGGLIVERTVHKNWTSDFSRPIGGVILFAPGVSIRKTPITFGNRLGKVTQETLTHDPNPPHKGPIKPDSPFLKRLTLFVANLLINSDASQLEPYPSDLKTLVFSGGNEADMYTKAWKIREWVQEKNLARAKEGTQNIVGISCPRSRHEMDNELPEFGAVEVRESAAEFAREIVSSDSNETQFETSQTFGKICSKI